jgi:thiazolylpeptide-type bacteriocin precursor
MKPNNEVESLAAEIAQLELETFEIADYDEANELFGTFCSTTSSTTSSCTA